MSQSRKHPDWISNWFDSLETGIGKRHSTFTDIDGISHDADSNRFLMREFKNDNEPLAAAQRWALENLAHLPRCTMWILRRCGERHIAFENVTARTPVEVITIEQYQQRVRDWWYALDPIVGTLPGEPLPMMTSDEIPWNRK